MGATTKTAFVTAFAIAVMLHLLFGGSRMAGAVLNGGLMENTAIGGMNWMWIPALLILVSAFCLFGSSWEKEVASGKHGLVQSN